MTVYFMQRHASCGMLSLYDGYCFECNQI